MSAFGTAAVPSGSGKPPRIELYTAAYRVAGRPVTRFRRVGDILNQTASTHLALEEATVIEHAAPSVTLAAEQVLVALDEVLIGVVTEAGDPVGQAEMRIPTRAVRAQMAIPPFRVTGRVHVAVGSSGSDGVISAGERFMAMTEASVECAAYPHLASTVAAIAVQRGHAHLIVVADDERPDQLLADVLDERTARGWLARDHPAE